MMGEVEIESIICPSRVPIFTMKHEALKVKLHNNWQYAMPHLIAMRPVIYKNGKSYAVGGLMYGHPKCTIGEWKFNLYHEKREVVTYTIVAEYKNMGGPPFDWTVAETRYKSVTFYATSAQLRAFHYACGDVNRDGKVTIVDISKIADCFHKSPVGNCSGCDITGDGKINILDISIAASNHGLTIEEWLSGGSYAPEPSEPPEPPDW